MGIELHCRPSVLSRLVLFGFSSLVVWEQKDAGSRWSPSGSIYIRVFFFFFLRMYRVQHME